MMKFVKHDALWLSRTVLIVIPEFNYQEISSLLRPFIITIPFLNHQEISSCTLNDLASSYDK